MLPLINLVGLSFILVGAAEAYHYHYDHRGHRSYSINTLNRKKFVKSIQRSDNVVHFRHKLATQLFSMYDEKLKVIDDFVKVELFTYADLSPYNEKTWEGIVFLLTNVLYLFTGYLDFQNGLYGYALAIEIAGWISVWYHWAQLHYGPDSQNVKLALTVDYLTAIYAIIRYLQLAIDLIHFQGPGALPIECILNASISLVCLLTSWTRGFNQGIPYMLFHGSWHIFSALAAGGLGKCAIEANIPTVFIF